MCARVLDLKTLVENLQEGEEADKQVTCQLKEGVVNIECNVSRLFESHQNIQKSVDITQIDIRKINDQLTAMQLQLDELASATSESPQNKETMHENKTALEMPVRTKSDDPTIGNKGSWNIPGDDGLRGMIDSLRSEVKNLKEEVGVNTSERSLLKMVKEFLNEEVQRIQQNPSMMMRMISKDSGMESIKQTAGSQVDTPSSEGSSLQLSFSRQQSSLSNSSQKASEAAVFYLEDSLPPGGIDKLNSSSQCSVGSPSSNNSKLPSATAAGTGAVRPTAITTYTNSPPVRATTDPSTTRTVVSGSPSLAAGYPLPPCSCTCEQRLNDIVLSLHKLVDEHFQ